MTTGTLPAYAMDPTGITADVTLQSGWLMPNGNYMAALQVKLAPGWHVIKSELDKTLLFKILIGPPVVPNLAK